MSYAQVSSVLSLAYKNSTFCAGRLIDCLLITKLRTLYTNLLIDILTNVQFYINL